jgi:lauroyl/myristoyl acyltransferase
MEALLAGTVRAGYAEALALGTLREHEALHEVFWRAWLFDRMEIRGIQHRDAALASGRGVLLSFVHQGPFHSMGVVLGDAVHRGRVLAGPWMFEEPPDRRWRRRLVYWQMLIGRSGLTMVRSTGAYATMRDMLRANLCVFNAFDMPGSHRMEFLNKPVDISIAGARVAMETGALVLPLGFGRDGHRPVAFLGEPLDPSDFPDVDALQARLARAHEQSVLARPEAMESPRRAGAWEGGATGQGWFRPNPPVS